MKAQAFFVPELLLDFVVIVFFVLVLVGIYLLNLKFVAITNPDFSYRELSDILVNFINNKCISNKRWEIDLKNINNNCFKLENESITIIYENKKIEIGKSQEKNLKLVYPIVIKENDKKYFGKVIIER